MLLQLAKKKLLQFHLLDKTTQLLSLRNELNLATVEGQTALAGINVKLDENNAFIKENVSSYEQQKIAIGDYKTKSKRHSKVLIYSMVVLVVL
jgi:hypothetical protein